ncbi:DUF1353 domain-containing protein [Verrucomicrobium spinosum]|uniref:DUF1353 domain-containing protein n=1 Tax=Verrucomicrobium spinosum TaxID=2736 RepID=UPI0009D6DBD8|nr:DUF1353 domain-containing protein [Verrucomicrobium spinosum]
MQNHPKQPYALPIPSPDDGPLYRVTSDWSYVWKINRRTYRLRVPRGFEFDGASVPWWMWSLLRVPPDGLHRAAALAHDYLYRHVGRVPLGHQQELIRGKWMDCTSPWLREEADALFARILRECGVSMVRRRLMYLGVRIFGKSSWKTRIV